MSTASRPAADWQVICLCAEWCGVCREWHEAFGTLRERYPHVAFAWIDVEDEADAMGDVDVETFPTLLVAKGDRARFLGPVQPSAAQVSRVLDGFLADPHDGRDAPPPAGALLARLRTRMLPHR